MQSTSGGWCVPECSRIPFCQGCTLVNVCFSWFSQHIQYEYDPCDDDPVEHVTAEHDSSAATLSKEARRWATKIAKENNTVKESVRKLQIYTALRESGQKVICTNNFFTNFFNAILMAGNNCFVITLS